MASLPFFQSCITATSRTGPVFPPKHCIKIRYSNPVTSIPAGTSNRNAFQ